MQLYFHNGTFGLINQEMTEARSILPVQTKSEGRQALISKNLID